MHNRKLKDSQQQRETPEGTRETKRGSREGVGLILGPDETNEEEEEEEEEDNRTTEEGETKSRRISTGVRRHHTNRQRIMVRA